MITPTKIEQLALQFVVEHSKLEAMGRELEKQQARVIDLHQEIERALIDEGLCTRLQGVTRES